MDEQRIPDIILQSLKSFASELTPLSVFGFILSICILTRIITEITGRFKRVHEDGTIAVRTVPYWLPYLGHGLSLGFRRRKLFENVRCDTKTPINSLIRLWSDI